MNAGFCFDFDGTITDRELLPYLAEAIDLADEIGVLTKATMDGHLDFRKSFKLRCRLLSSIPVSAVRELVSHIRLEPTIASFIRAHRDQCAIVTGNLDCWIGPFVAEHLGCHLASSTGMVEEDHLRGIDEVLDKGTAVARLRSQHGWERLVCIGDGMNDVPMLEQADIAIAYGGVHAPCVGAIESAHYVVHDPRSLCRLISQL
jgi:HAD superfamily phosphoserine phosphatase-like hydrolase